MASKGGIRVTVKNARTQNVWYLEKFGIQVSGIQISSVFKITKNEVCLVGKLSQNLFKVSCQMFTLFMPKSGNKNLLPDLNRLYTAQRKPKSTNEIDNTL